MTRLTSFGGPNAKALRIIALVGAVPVIIAAILFFSPSQSATQSTDVALISPLPQRDELPLPRSILLTIAVDNIFNCPNDCAFVHELLPPWVRYRYKQLINHNPRDLNINSHTLFVARSIGDPGPLTDWTRSFRKSTNFSVGVLVMADEHNDHNKTYFPVFDYVLRHYFFPEEHVRALGNLTCGTGPTWPASEDSPLALLAPPLGVHWVVLSPLGPQLAAAHPPHTYWPASARDVPCVFVGSVKGREHREKMVEIMLKTFPDADISMEVNFKGSVGPFEYSHHRMGNAKFALNPDGTNPECHRFLEIVQQGTIPVIIDSPYLHATFSRIPGLVAQSWEEAAVEMKRLIERPEELDQLQENVMAWARQLKSCSTGDLDKILRKAMNRVSD